MQAPSSIEDAIRTAGHDTAEAQRLLSKAFEANKEAFINACVPLMLTYIDRPGAQTLVSFLIGQGQIERLLLARELSVQTAGQILRLARRVDPGIEAALWMATQANSQDALLRLMEVFAIGGHEQLGNEILVRLAQHDDPFLRSKAELLLGRRQQDYERIQARLGDPDDRIAANAVESIWGQRGEAAQRIFRYALEHPHNRVRGNGAIGLYRAGHPAAISYLMAMAEDSRPMYRATAFKAMELCGDVRFLGKLAGWMGRAPSEDRERMVRAMTAIEQQRKAIVEKGSLRIRFADAARNAAGDRRIRFSVVDPAAAQILAEDQLLGTSVVPVEDQQLILDYRLKPKHVDRPVAIQVLLPEGVDSSVQAVRTLCRPRDRWDFRTFANAGEEGAALTTALRQLAETAAARHLVWCARQPEPVQLSSPVLRSAEAAHVTIHTILPPDAPSSWLLQMEGVARETGGFTIREDLLENGLGLVLANIVGSFELTYNRKDADQFSAPELRIQVYTPRGFAEESTLIGRHD